MNFPETMQPLTQQFLTAYREAIPENIRQECIRKGLDQTYDEIILGSELCHPETAADLITHGKFVKTYLAGIMGMY